MAIGMAWIESMLGQADQPGTLQVAMVVQGSQYRDVSGTQGTENLTDASTIDLTLAQLVYAADGSWAASIESGSWGSRVEGLHSGSTSSPVVFTNTTGWCGRTWEASLQLIEALEGAEGAGGIAFLDGGNKGDGDVSQLGQLCDVRVCSFLNCAR